MSQRVASSQLFSGSHVVSLWGGLGIPGAQIPTTGDNGGSPLADDDILAGAEYRLIITAQPSAGTLVPYPDTSFEFSGAPDGSYSYTYQAWENSVIYGSATDTLVVGEVNATVPGGAGTSTGSGSGGAATGVTAGDGNAPGGTGTSIGSGTGGAASGEGGFSGSLSDEDIARIVAAVLAALQATAIPVNIKQVNSVPIKGAGVNGNTWGPA